MSNNQHLVIVPTGYRVRQGCIGSIGNGQTSFTAGRCTLNRIILPFFENFRPLFLDFLINMSFPFPVIDFDETIFLKKRQRSCAYGDVRRLDSP